MNGWMGGYIDTCRCKYRWLFEQEIDKWMDR